MQAAGFVLAGGGSSRMGQDKARLRLHERPLIEFVAGIVKQAVGNVTLVGNPSAYVDLPFACLPDLRPNRGPLAGIETALMARRAEFNVVAGCDMPDIQASQIARLLAAAQESAALCAVARDAAGQKHPLLAVYRAAALPIIHAALDERRLRLLDLVEELKAVEVPIDSVLSNVNTPEQWAVWRATHLA